MPERHPISIPVAFGFAQQAGTARMMQLDTRTAGIDPSKHRLDPAVPGLGTHRQVRNTPLGGSGVRQPRYCHVRIIFCLRLRRLRRDADRHGRAAVYGGAGETAALDVSRSPYSPFAAAALI